MELLFQEHCPYELYSNILYDPLDADYKAKIENTEDKPYTFLHENKLCFISDDGIKHSNKPCILRDKIKNLYFVYVDCGEQMFDDKYYFFIGELNDKWYFSYETECSGTGFGICSTSRIHFSRSFEQLYNLGLTDAQRQLINDNINERFVIKKSYD